MLMDTLVLSLRSTLAFYRAVCINPCWTCLSAAVLIHSICCASIASREHVPFLLLVFPLSAVVRVTEHVTGTHIWINCGLWKSLIAGCSPFISPGY